MYKDKEKQKEKNKEANRRYRLKKQGITEKPVIDEINNAQDSSGCVIPVIPDTNDTLKRDTLSDTLTPEQIVKLSAAEAKAILRGWAEGNGDGYQYRLGNLALEYDVIKSGYPLSHLIPVKEQDNTRQAALN